MGFKINITKLAEAEISEAFVWYNKQKPNLVNAFKLDFLNKFPYGIHYFIDKNTIIVCLFIVQVVNLRLLNRE